jgi:hypothetical protein
VSVLFPYHVEVTKENLAGPIKKAMETKEGFFIKLFKIMFMYFPTWTSTFIFFYEIDSHWQIFFVFTFFLLDSCSFFLKKHAKLSKEEIEFHLQEKENKCKINNKKVFFEKYLFTIITFIIFFVYSLFNFEDSFILRFLYVFLLFALKCTLMGNIILYHYSHANIVSAYNNSRNFYFFYGIGRFPYLLICILLFFSSPFFSDDLFASDVYFSDPEIIVKNSIFFFEVGLLLLLRLRITYEVVFLAAKYWVEENKKHD